MGSVFVRRCVLDKTDNDDVQLAKAGAPSPVDYRTPFQQAGKRHPRSLCSFSADDNLRLRCVPPLLQKICRTLLFFCRSAKLSSAFTMGSKKNRMVYAPTQEHGKQVKIEDVPLEQRDIFSLTNEEVQELAKQAVQIEKHYGRPMDIEWAKDGHTGKLFIVQARPKPCAHAVRSWSVIRCIHRVRLSPKAVLSVIASARVRESHP